MNSIICPNDGSEMENDEAFARRAKTRQHAVTHTCDTCGYSEVR